MNEREISYDLMLAIAKAEDAFKNFYKVFKQRDVKFVLGAGDPAVSNYKVLEFTDGYGIPIFMLCKRKEAFTPKQKQCLDEIAAAVGTAAHVYTHY